METIALPDAISSQWSLLLASLLLAAVLLIARFLMLRYWHDKWARSSASRRQARVFSRNIVIALLIFGMAIIWAPELQAFALSIAAFAVALVIAMKELLLATLGGIYRLITQAYKVGDWVSVGAVRGEVVDTGVTATTFQELGPGRHGASYTGQKIVLPNSMLLTSPVINEHEVGPFVLHNISVPFKLGEDVATLEQVLADAARKAFDPKDPALIKFTKTMSQLLDFPIAGLTPKFQVRFTESETAWLQISLYLPVQCLPEKEHEIAKAYLDWRHLQKPEQISS